MNFDDVHARRLVWQRDLDFAVDTAGPVAIDDGERQCEDKIECDGEGEGMAG